MNTDKQLICPDVLYLTNYNANLIIKSLRKYFQSYGFGSNDIQLKQKAYQKNKFLEAHIGSVRVNLDNLRHIIGQFQNPYVHISQCQIYFNDKFRIKQINHYMNLAKEIINKNIKLIYENEKCSIRYENQQLIYEPKLKGEVKNMNTYNDEMLARCIYYFIVEFQYASYAEFEEYISLHYSI